MGRLLDFDSCISIGQILIWPAWKLKSFQIWCWQRCSAIFMTILNEHRLFYSPTSRDSQNDFKLIYWLQHYWIMSLSWAKQNGNIEHDATKCDSKRPLVIIIEYYLIVYSRQANILITFYLQCINIPIYLGNIFFILSAHNFIKIGCFFF